MAAAAIANDYTPQQSPNFVEYSRQSRGILSSRADAPAKRTSPPQVVEIIENCPSPMQGGAPQNVNKKATDYRAQWDAGAVAPAKPEQTKVAEVFTRKKELWLNRLAAAQLTAYGLFSL